MKRKRLLIESSTISLVKSWDAIIIGGGIIGLSIAIALRKQGLRVLIVERGEPGREASYAAAGMLAGSGLEIPVPLRPLAEESARLYPEFVVKDFQVISTNPPPIFQSQLSGRADAAKTRYVIEKPNPEF